jgi:hypothetical protein
MRNRGLVIELLSKRCAVTQWSRTTLAGEGW